MKQIGNGADVRSHVLNQSFALGHGSGHFCKMLKIAAHRGQIHRERRQGLSHTVVQFARDSASLFVLKMKQTSGKVAQTSIGFVELSGAFFDHGFQLLLSFGVLFMVPAIHFSHRHDKRGREQEGNHANRLGQIRDAERMRRLKE